MRSPAPQGAEFVVVGAGSSGAALAGRLAERGADVLLIERGPDWLAEDAPQTLRRPPPDVFAWKVGGKTPEDFTYYESGVRRWHDAAPEPYIRGRGLGGTSTVNGLVAIRPPLEEFDEWAEAGCVDWGSSNALPLLRRLESDNEFGHRDYHGQHGPTPIVRRSQKQWGIGDKVVADAAHSAGHEWEPDHNRPGALGFSPIAMNIRAGVRWTTNDGYIEPNRYRGNLRILARTMVDRVHVSHGRAAGVVIVRDGEQCVIPAGTVVLAAGASSSPAILQRSGIGPRAISRALGIPIVADLPVGIGVQDHFGFWLSLYLHHPGATPTGARGNVTLRHSSGLPFAAAGDLLHVSANPLPSDPHHAALGVKLAQIHSRGYLAITSRDPWASPEIALNLLADDRDRTLARHALRDALKMLAASKHLAAVAAPDGTRLTSAMDDTDVDAFLRQHGRDTAHLSGGARMGSPSAATSVVDPDGRVLGVPELIVADLAICPWVPRANTHLTAILIGERIADALQPPDRKITLPLASQESHP